MKSLSGRSPGASVARAKETPEGFTPSGDSRWIRSLYANVAPLYDLGRRLWGAWTRSAERELDRLFSSRIDRNSRVLELAPGTGVNLERLFCCAPSFGSYLGIDLSDPMLRRARKKSRGDRRVMLRVGDATELSPALGSFDFIVCTWLLSHLTRPAETVRRALERLAPGGSAVFLFLTRSESPLVRVAVGLVLAPFRVRPVDARTIGRLPHFQRLTRHGGGSASLAVFQRHGAWR